MKREVTARLEPNQPCRHRPSVALGSWVCLLAMIAASPTSGRAEPPGSDAAPGLEDSADPREKLEMLQRRLEQDREAQQKLDQDRAVLAQDAAKLQRDLIAAATQVRNREIAQAKVERELAVLETKESLAARAFYERRDQLAALLAVLQRMGREPPPALLVQPENAADAARSAMVLTAVLPGVRDEAKKLSSDLAELRSLRLAASNTRVNLSKANEALAAEQKRIAALLDEKQSRVAQTSVELRAAVARVNASAKQVQDVEHLIRRVSGEIKELSEAGFAAQHFLAQRGRLPWPSNGQLIANFGEENELGVRNSALTLKTRPNAQVVSPVDGKIAFAGPFPGYGHLLIIVTGDDYHVVLFGMAKIFGEAGQVLLAGEPVGQMGEAQGADVGNRLSIEFRHSGTPVDPGPWFDGYEERRRDKGHG